MNNKNFRFYMSGSAQAIINSSWDDKNNRPHLTPEKVAELALEYATALAETTDATIAKIGTDVETPVTDPA